MWSIAKIPALKNKEIHRIVNIIMWHNKRTGPIIICICYFPYWKKNNKINIPIDLSLVRSLHKAVQQKKEKTIMMHKKKK